MTDLDTLKNAGIGKVLSNPELRQLFHEVAKREFGESCLNCTGKIREQYEKLFDDKFNGKPKINMGEYKLRKGAIIHMTAADWKATYGTGNMTDEIAVRLLNRDLRYVKFFDDCPNIEKIRKAMSENVRTLEELNGHQEPELNVSYYDKLIALNGIGDRMAKKIIDNYPTEEVLRDALEHEVQMDFFGVYEEGIKVSLKEF